MNDASGAGLQTKVARSRFFVIAVLWVTLASPAIGQAQAPVPHAGDSEVRAPFTLTAEEQRFIDELLTAWESRSREIKKVDCHFSRWEYNPQFGPRNPQNQLLATSISIGDIKYVRPDKGIFHVTETQFWNPQANKKARRRSASISSATASSFTSWTGKKNR
jgi:hypothetical protein